MVILDMDLVVSGGLYVTRHQLSFGPRAKFNLRAVEHVVQGNM